MVISTILPTIVGEFRQFSPAFYKNGRRNLKFYYGAVAQLVEQWTENPCVGGSIPPRTTI